MKQPSVMLSAIYAWARRAALRQTKTPASALLLPSSKQPHTPLALLLTTLALSTSPSDTAVAEDLLYIGGAIGPSRVDAKETVCFCDLGGGPTTETIIDKRTLAFQAMLGVRPISPVGAEVDYIDLGKANSEAFGFPASASVKGAAAFGVLFLPVPIVNLYLKAGVARLKNAVDFSYCSPCACTFCLNSGKLTQTNTTGAGGVGVQYKFGSWAVRAEYERFNAAGENPSLLSAGLTWSFL